MYIVIATVSHPEAENDVVLRGQFVPKSESTSIEKIEGQVAAFIRKKIKIKNSSEITTDDVKISVVAVPYHLDFQLVEDKD